MGVQHLEKIVSCQLTRWFVNIDLVYAKRVQKKRIPNIFVCHFSWIIIICPLLMFR